jgi:UDP-N-acetylglucosamine diphosphorylase / glucose-1-phosphate thymidylyltransferase / UDP-N-acetylgalactosamine diphosphorylase / glucosamine-1-phosphate N-acetyltransferase / galactosamine-1-phosphate N-acetyltransferase
MMPNLILFDDPTFRQNLLPLALTRPIAAIRIGIDSIAEKWARYYGVSCSFLTENYLSQKYITSYSATNIYINGAYCPNEILLAEIENLNENETLFDGEILVAFKSTEKFTSPLLPNILKFNKKLTLAKSVAIRQLVDIFIYNGKQLEADFQQITRGLSSEKVNDPFTVLYNEAQIHIGQNASIKSAVLDASTGPIFIDDNAKIEIGSMIQGPFYLGKNSILSLGSKIRPNTSIGPNCKVGGEVSKSVIFGNSNKSHDGFMGCSVIGEWCNWGAGTNNSNLKNDYGMVDMYNYASQNMEPTGQLFAGTIMGDYCKTAIGTVINTGTVFGISSNIFQEGFPAKFIPSFTWGGNAANSTKYRLDKAIQVIKETMKRRNIEMTKAEKEILEEIFKNTP